MNRRRTTLSVLALVLVCVPLVLIAAESDGAPPAADSAARPRDDSGVLSGAAERPRISLVLSGGGARGLAHVGVLEVLEKFRVPVDCVVGTSMGALVGGAFAAGVSPAEMNDVLDKTDIAALFDDLPPRSQVPQRVKRDDYRPLFGFTLGFNRGELQLSTGVSAGYKFELFLKDLVGPGAAVAGLDFDTLPTPYRAIATDLETGEMKVFHFGDLPKVMRASMSLPAVFAPAEIDGRSYVDGALVRNIPVDIGRKLCADAHGDVVIAVNLGTPLKSRDNLRSVIDVTSQAINLLTEQNVQRSLAELDDTDILIEPRLEGFGVSDFESTQAIIGRGREATRQMAAKLSQLSVDEQSYDAWLAQRERRHLPEYRVTRITVAASERFNAAAVEEDLKVRTGEDFSTNDLNENLARMYGRADFSYLGYSVVSGDDGADVIIDATAKPWGPGYLKFGVGITTDFNSPAQSNLALGYRRTWANSLGAEWRVDAQFGYFSFLSSEFLQPLQVRDGAFIAPYVAAQREFFQIYDEQLRLGQFRVNSVRAGLDVGLTGSVGELRLGPYVNSIRTESEFGASSPLLPSQQLTQVGLQLRGVVDQLDTPTFPRSGWLAAMDVHGTEQGWGSEDEYTRATAVLRGVKTFGKNTFAARVEFGEALFGEIPGYDPFQLGGPERLSGLYLSQLTGNRYNLGTLGYYRQYAQLPSQLGRGAYLGLSLEAGRIDDPLMKDPWDWVYAGSVYWAADTVLGSVYIGYGYASLGQQSVYLKIGPQF